MIEATVVRMKRWLPYILAIEVLGIVVFSLAYDSLDFRIYWLGGDAVTDGTRLYDQQLAAHWFTNTPFLAALFTPLSELPLTLARLLWQLASLAAFTWACATTLKLTGKSFPLKTVVAGALLLAPVWHSFFQGQVNLFLLALVLADMHRVSRGSPAGIGIGVATAIKLTPGIFIVLLLATRRTKDALTAAGAFAVCTLLAHAIAPDASRLYWLHTFYDTSRVGVPYISNQSPLGALTRTLRGTADVGDWYTAVPLLIGTAGIFLAAAWARRGDWLTAVAVTGTTGLLVSPVSWAHHWVWIVPALAVLIRDGHRKIATCGYVLFAVAPMWLTPYLATPLRPGWHLLLLPVANCYLLAGLLFLAHSFFLLHSTSPFRPTARPHPGDSSPRRPSVTGSAASMSRSRVGPPPPREPAEPEAGGASPHAQRLSQTTPSPPTSPGG